MEQAEYDRRLRSITAERDIAGGRRTGVSCIGALLDIGCGAGRNALPLARAGWEVIGTDLSLPMLEAAATRVVQDQLAQRVSLLMAPMNQLPFVSESFDFIVAHGIRNLARSGREFRQAVRRGRTRRTTRMRVVPVSLRQTLVDSATPVPGESFVFTQFSGEPQCFLTAEQVVSELGAWRFEPDPALPLRELNERPKGALRTSSGPVIYQGMFRCKGR